MINNKPTKKIGLMIKRGTFLDFFLHTRATANAININIVITLSKMLNIRFAI